MADSEQTRLDEEGPLESVRSWLSRTARIVTGSTVDVENYDPARHEPLVRFDGLAGKE